MLPDSLQTAIDELSKLPGIGPRTAERLAFHLLREGESESTALGNALGKLHDGIRLCSTCHHIAESDLCDICTSPRRDTSVIAIVEEPLDVIAIEKTGAYRGLYHVLGGVLSPIDGIGPKQLNVTSLLKRLGDKQLEEVILATNASTEGEATALYVQRQIEDKKLRLSRLARGLPVGSDLEYADQITLGRALEGRQAL